MTKFHKVSFEQYERDRSASVDDLQAEYDAIQLPKRATAKSAGYDFFAPFDIVMVPGQAVQFSTGIRVELEDNQFLACYPRSGLGFKYMVGLANTVGIIDADYFGAENEGHIGVKLINRGDQSVHIDAGKAFMQGIIQTYAVTDDDDATGERTGGFGSTDAAQSSQV